VCSQQFQEPITYFTSRKICEHPAGCNDLKTNRQTPEGKNSIIYVQPAVFRDNENSGLGILLTLD